MKFAVAFVLVAAVCAVNGAPVEERSFLGGILGNNFGCSSMVNCFVDPCMMGCAAHPDAVCNAGCYCSATYTVNGVTVQC